jgi:hypothetical protein
VLSILPGGRLSVVTYVREVGSALSVNAKVHSAESQRVFEDFTKANKIHVEKINNVFF